MGVLDLPFYVIMIEEDDEWRPVILDNGTKKVLAFTTASLAQDALDTIHRQSLKASAHDLQIHEIGTLSEAKWLLTFSKSHGIQALSVDVKSDSTHARAIRRQEFWNYLKSLHES